MAFSHWRQFIPTKIVPRHRISNAYTALILCIIFAERTLEMVYSYEQITNSDGIRIPEPRKFIRCRDPQGEGAGALVARPSFAGNRKHYDLTTPTPAPTALRVPSLKMGLVSPSDTQ